MYSVYLCPQECYAKSNVEMQSAKDESDLWRQLGSITINRVGRLQSTEKTNVTKSIITSRAQSGDNIKADLKRLFLVQEDLPPLCKSIHSFITGVWSTANG